MDLSPEYIKQCEKAEEIQLLKKYDDGNYFANFVSGKWQKPYIYSYGRCIPYDFGDYDVWLPRLDQLQEILLAERYEEKYDLFSMFAAYLHDKPDVMSAEQLWLAFVMNEKNKVWDGDEWVTRR